MHVWGRRFLNLKIGFFSGKKPIVLGKWLRSLTSHPKLIPLCQSLIPTFTFLIPNYIFPSLTFNLSSRSFNLSSRSFNLSSRPAFFPSPKSFFSSRSFNLSSRLAFFSDVLEVFQCSSFSGIQETSRLHFGYPFLFFPRITIPVSSHWLNVSSSQPFCFNVLASSYAGVPRPFSVAPAMLLLRMYNNTVARLQALFVHIRTILSPVAIRTVSIHTAFTFAVCELSTVAIPLHSLPCTQLSL